MKICKNNFDIALYPVTKCSQCVLNTRTHLCLWLKVYYKASLDCGGVRVNILSDIFKL